MQRTIRIQLEPSTETIKVLAQTVEQYTWSFNAVCRHGWEHNLSSGNELHKATYYDHRTLTGLPSQLVCAARVKATEALKSVRARKRKKETVCCPHSKFCAIRYVQVMSVQNSRKRLDFPISSFCEYHQEMIQTNLLALFL